ncbi:MAG: TIGR01777 family oxidoreductase [Planctomycetota bacterium]|nr:TIGR01777 family oxidoreductase [Planctomycetota bacterium]
MNDAGQCLLPIPPQSVSRHVAVTGSSGLLGSALHARLTAVGQRVTRIVRSRPGAGDVLWDPTAPSFDSTKLAGVAAFVHLAGENIATRRWTPSVKRRIRDSRVLGTQMLCELLARWPSPPKVLVTASAIGFYGNRGDAWLDEQSEPGDGFLAQVAGEWEAATQVALDAGMRVVCLRFGVVLSPRGGALAKMLLPFKLGLGGRVGSGRQWWSWISLDDAVGAICHVIDVESLSGPVNAVAPHPVTNAEFTRVLGRVLHRPARLPMPAVAARLALGEMADHLLLASTRVVPRRLLQTGYAFQHPTLADALQHCLT